MKLEGSLDQFPIRELIEMIIYSSVSGILNIYGDQNTGQIFFSSGRPYHAVYGKKGGMDAVVALFEETDAGFSFTDDSMQPQAEETIFSDPLEMIEIAERLAARWQRVRKHISSMDCIPYLTCPMERARYSVSPEHWAIFTNIDAQRSIESIAQELNFDLIEVGEAIAQMKGDNLIELRRPQLRAMDVTLDTPPSSPENKTGVLDRLLAKTSAKVGTPQTEERAQPTPSPREPCPTNEDPILRLLRS